MKKAICIFGASSDRINREYKDAAYEMGRIIAKNGFMTVSGAGASGIMGAVAKGVHDEGGELLGVIPERLNLPGIASEYCTELIVTPTMHVRKAVMEQNSQGFIALPGGFGTFEELLEVITLKQLGYIDLPIVILNTCSYYDSMIKMFDDCVRENMAHEKSLELFYAAKTPVEAMEYIKNYQKSVIPDKIEQMVK